jgi:hypothetical protein
MSIDQQHEASRGRYHVPYLQKLPSKTIFQLVAAEVRRHLPALIIFPSEPQHSGAPGPQQHAGILAGFAVEQVHKPKPKWKYGIFFEDPLNVVDSNTVHVLPADQRSYKVFGLNPFMATCYYNWDVEGRWGKKNCYRRSGYVKGMIQMSPGDSRHYEALGSIFPRAVREVSNMTEVCKFLNGTNNLPAANPQLASQLPKTFNPSNFLLDVGGRSSLKGRGDHDASMKSCARSRKNTRTKWTRKRKLKDEPVSFKRKNPLKSAAYPETKDSDTGAPTIVVVDPKRRKTAISEPLIITDDMMFEDEGQQVKNPVVKTEPMDPTQITGDLLPLPGPLLTDDMFGTVSSSSSAPLVVPPVPPLPPVASHTQVGAVDAGRVMTPTVIITYPEPASKEKPKVERQDGDEGDVGTMSKPDNLFDLPDIAALPTLGSPIIFDQPGQSLLVPTTSPLHTSTSPFGFNVTNPFDPLSLSPPMHGDFRSLSPPGFMGDGWTLDSFAPMEDQSGVNQSTLNQPTLSLSPIPTRFSPTNFLADDPIVT